MATRAYGVTLSARLRAYALALGVIGLFLAAAIAPSGLVAASTVDAEERLALELINQERSAQGLPALAFSATLQAAAEWMSLDQAGHSELSHDDSLGRGLRSRLSDFGYPADTSIWENAAAGGQLDGLRVVPLWIDSPPHLDNILASSARAAGLARARNDNGRWYWTLDMGSSLSDDDRLNIEAGIVAPQPPAPTWALVGWSAPDLDVATAALAFGWTSAVFGWNAAVAGFDTYFSAAPPSINSLETLRTGQAYWVELDRSGSVPQLPAGPTDGLVQLSRGLNLVSWLGPGGVSLADVARSVGPGLVTMWAWDFARQRYVVYSPLLPAGLVDYVLGTGAGLWVSVDRPIAWQQTP